MRGLGFILLTLWLLAGCQTAPQTAPVTTSAPSTTDAILQTFVEPPFLVPVTPNISPMPQSPFPTVLASATPTPPALPVPTVNYFVPALVTAPVPTPSADEPMVLIDQPVAMPTTNLLVAWDYDGPCDGFHIDFAGQHLDVPYTNEALLPPLPLTAGVAITVTAFNNAAVPVVTPLSIGTNLIWQTNYFSDSSSSQVVWVPMNAIFLQLSNNVSLVSFATAPGVICHVQGSADIGGPFVELYYDVIGTTNEVVTMAIPRTAPQQFYRIAYAYQ